MSLITEQKEALISKKNIIVYKEIKVSEDYSSYISIYHDFKWEFNKLYKTEINIKPITSNKRQIIPYDPIAKEFYLKKNLYSLFTISEGFHTMTKKRIKRTSLSFNWLWKDTLGLKDMDIIVKCIIPKNSLYYKDKTGLYVSNQLIVLKEVTLKDLI